ncbi:MAG: ATP-binding protein [Proteobacteria bacterium]|nr:ATP-binding protein [Pseudomonadota bacterium]
MKLFSASMLAVALLAGCGGGDDNSNVAPIALPSTQVTDGAVVDANGMSLYVFDKDTAGNGKSACNGQCANNWPPLSAPDNAQSIGSYSVVQRNEGTKQWAYNGLPLYFYFKDAKPGDRLGDGVGGVWHLARP